MQDIYTKIFCRFIAIERRRRSIMVVQNCKLLKIDLRVINELIKHTVILNVDIIFGMCQNISMQCVYISLSNRWLFGIKCK